MNVKKIISFLGPYGSYSHIATVKYMKIFCKHYLQKEYNNFIKIFDSLENNISNYAIVPFENNSSGFIDETYKLLCEKNISIIAEFSLSIQHYLVAKKNVNLHSIKTIYSHPQPFYQCSKFIKNFTSLNVKYTSSTSEAMKKIAMINSHNIAAIGNKKSAKMYNLKIILSNISNKINNITKFIFLKKKNNNTFTTNYIKTIFILVKNKITLNEIIYIFQKNNIYITINNIRIHNIYKIQKTIYIEIIQYLNSKDIYMTLYSLYQKNIIIKFFSCYPILKI